MKTFLSDKCTKSHIGFIKQVNGDYQAVDLLCGTPYDGKIWYCSKDCMNKDIANEQ